MSATNCTCKSCDPDVADLVELFEKRLHMPSYMRRCVVDVVNQGKSTDQAFAICQRTMQKAGYMTSGPGQKQKKKGKKRARHFSAKKDMKAYDQEYSDILKTSRAKTKLKKEREREGFKGLADRLELSMGSSEALIESEVDEADALANDIVKAIIGDRKVSDDIQKQVKGVVLKEIKKKNDELSEEALTLGVLSTAAILGLISASLLALAAISVIAFVAATGEQANKAGIKAATEEASEEAESIAEKAKERSSEGKSKGGKKKRKKKSSDLPSKKVGDPDIYEFKGKKGVWRTLENGDRVFFPQDGSRPMGGDATISRSNK